MTKLLLRAQVLRRKGPTASLPWLKAASKRLPIQFGSRSFREDDAGDGLADTWHETVADAKRAADNEYETTGWRSLPAME